MWILYVVTFSSSFYLSIPFILMQILSFVGGELGNKNWREREKTKKKKRNWFLFPDEEEKEKLISIAHSPYFDETHYQFQSSINEEENIEIDFSWRVL